MLPPHSVQTTRTFSQMWELSFSRVYGGRKNLCGESIPIEPPPAVVVNRQGTASRVITTSTYPHTEMRCKMEEIIGSLRYYGRRVQEEKEVAFRIRSALKVRKCPTFKFLQNKVFFKKMLYCFKPCHIKQDFFWSSGKSDSISFHLPGQALCLPKNYYFPTLQQRF